MAVDMFMRVEGANGEIEGREPQGDAGRTSSPSRGGLRSPAAWSAVAAVAWARPASTICRCSRASTKPAPAAVRKELRQRQASGQEDRSVGVQGRWLADRIHARDARGGAGHLGAVHTAEQGSDAVFRAVRVPGRRGQAAVLGTDRQGRQRAPKPSSAGTSRKTGKPEHRAYRPACDARRPVRCPCVASASSSLSPRPHDHRSFIAHSALGERTSSSVR